MDEVAGIALTLGYPEPLYGVTVFAGPRGDANNGVDWALGHLRDYAEELIVHVVEDCISVVQQEKTMSEESRKGLVQALRDHFEIVVQ